MTKVRAKFVCTDVKTEETHPPRRGEKVTYKSFGFTPVYSEEEGSENKKFWDATPSGSLRLDVVNRDVWDKFVLGKEYYLDIVPADDE